LKKLLLVEDNLETQLIIKAMFRDIYNVQGVDNSDDAFSLLSKEHFDVLLLDINLNGKGSGKDLLAQIRDQEKTKNLPVVMVTAYDLTPEDEEFFSKNSNGVIYKPIDKKNLTAKVESLLNSN
jgi:CheY-like chemotaxis protein